MTLFERKVDPELRGILNQMLTMQATMLALVSQKPEPVDRSFERELHEKLLESKDQTRRDFDAVLQFHIATTKETLAIIQEATIEQLKITLQATLQQNASFADRIMSMTGQLLDFKLAQERVDKDYAANVAQTVDETAADSSRESIEARLEREADVAYADEERKMAEAYREGRLASDL